MGCGCMRITEKKMTEEIKRYVFSKRFLYTLCFIALMIIDWTRGSQVGSTWAWTINMTGVVMAVILFSAYHPKEFLRPVYIIYSAIGVAALPAAYYWWLHNQAVIYRDQLLTVVLNVWLLGIFVIKLFLDTVIYKIKKLKFCKIEIITGIMLLLILFSINEDIWAGGYLVMFGLFYHTEYSEDDMRALKQGMLDGIITAFFILQGLAFVFRPFDHPNHRYYGIYANCNMNALFYGIVWVAFLMGLYDARKRYSKKWKRLFCFLFAGALMAFDILTGCRTAWMAMIVTGFLYILIVDFNLLRYKTGQVLIKLFLYFLVVGISIPITYMAVRYLPPVFHHPVWYDGEYSEDKVTSMDAWDSEKYVSWEELSKGVTERIKPFFKAVIKRYCSGASMIVQAAEEVAIEEAGDTTETQLSRSFQSMQLRIDLWKYYLKNARMTGHFNSQGHKIEGISHRVWHTQNMFVQYWYYYGIPSGILFIVIMVLLLYENLKKILQKDDKALICLIYVIFFVMYGLFEVTWYPGQMVLFLAFFTPKFLKPCA